jgi:hypothetical protein
LSKRAWGQERAATPPGCPLAATQLTADSPATSAYWPSAELHEGHGVAVFSPVPAVPTAHWAHAPPEPPEPSAQLEVPGGAEGGLERFRSA